MFDDAFKQEFAFSSEVFAPEGGDLAASAFERVGYGFSAEFAVGAVFGVGEDVEVTVEGDGSSEEVGDDFLVEGGVEGKVWFWELLQFGVDYTG